MASSFAPQPFLTSHILAHTIGIALNGISIGVLLDLSFLGIPAVLAPHNKRLSKPSSEKAQSQISSEPASDTQHIAYQWTILYDRGKKIGPLTALISAACFTYVFRSIPVTPAFALQRRLLLAATISPVCIVPFTVGLMNNMNMEIYGRSDGIEDRKGKEKWQAYSTSQMLERWATFNACRAVFPALGVVVALAAMVL